MKSIAIIAIVALSLAFICPFSYGASKKTSGDILKEGVLGAGAGAVGGLASGAKGGDVWKGALAGAGVNIVGGALLDAMTGEKVDSVDNVQSMDSQTAYGTGYKEGYKQGYSQGYKEGIKEGAKTQ